MSEDEDVRQHGDSGNATGDSDSGTSDSRTADGGHGAGQGRDAAAAGTGGADDAELTEGERMARKLVRDVAAYEVDPPPPSRVEDGAHQSGEAPSPQ